MRTRTEDSPSRLRDRWKYLAAWLVLLTTFATGNLLPMILLVLGLALVGPRRRWSAPSLGESARATRRERAAPRAWALWGTAVAAGVAWIAAAPFAIVEVLERLPIQHPSGVPIDGMVP